jgi:hypothetical protein
MFFCNFELIFVVGISRHCDAKQISRDNKFLGFVARKVLWKQQKLYDQIKFGEMKKSTRYKEQIENFFLLRLMLLAAQIVFNYRQTSDG